MKKALRASAILAGLVLCFSVCQKPEPIPAPNPVSPVDTLVLEDEQTDIEFVWNSVDAALYYAIEIADNEIFNGALVFGNDELYDTTCKVSANLINLDSTYYWQVSAKGEDSWSAWSEIIEFTPVEQGTTLDLDTTYFPFGLGYEWCYERHDHYWDIWGTEWDNYDTVIIQVEDSTYDSIGWFFDLSGYYNDVCAGGSDARIIIQSPETYLVPIYLNWWWLRDTIYVSLTPSTRTGSTIIEYNADTLVMSNSCEYSEGFPTISNQITKRVKSFGVVWQNDSDADVAGKTEGFTKDRLLYFYNGVDTVYKAPQSEAFN